MAAALIVLALALATRVRRTKAWPLPSDSGSLDSYYKSCAEFMLPVSVTAHNADYGIGSINNNIDASLAPTRIVKNTTVQDTFNINTRLCIPENGSKRNHLQIATHGLFYDQRYWDVSIDPEEYSYVKAASDAGYSILTHDRLTTGKSDKPDAYTIAQAPLELEILRSITELARSGKIMQHAASNSPMSFDKIFHYGHSFGSYLTAALLATYGSLSDAAVLTGFLITSHASMPHVTSFGFEFAAENDPVRFRDRPSGYVVQGTESAVQTQFFSAKRDKTMGIGGFQTKLLDYAESTKQPGAAGEFPSLSSLSVGPSPEFRGPLQFMNGEYDFPACGGDCRDNEMDTIKLIYGNATDIDVYLQPGTGHGMTMHKGAYVGYKATLDWLDKNGL